jgi:hypothetical protein
MVNIQPAPADTAADARNRAVRTLVQSLLVDVALALVLALTPVLADIKWERSYWVAVGLLAARSVITAVLSWAARKLVPPKP